MMTVNEYDGFEQALADRGVRLRTSTTSYRTAHELPGWYDVLRDVTPASVWTVGDDVEELLSAAQKLGSGPAVLRDYVKSMKHYWTEAAYIPDLADTAAVERVARRFRELRAEAFTGGFVLRRFEEFVGAEARTWWVDGRCVLVTPHPDTPDELPDGVELAAVETAVGELGLPLVTVDLVQRADGVWRIVELGDGQVSDWPASRDAADLVGRLFPGG